MRKLNPQILVLALFGVIFAGGFARVHMRMQTTLIGYELGRLKAEESALLEKRGLLKMQLARLTTKQTLSSMTARVDNKNEATAVAAK